MKLRGRALPGKVKSVISTAFRLTGQCMTYRMPKVVAHRTDVIRGDDVSRSRHIESSNRHARRQGFNHDQAEGIRAAGKYERRRPQRPRAPALHRKDNP